MGKGLHKSLHIYLAKLRRSLTTEPNQDSSYLRTAASATTSRLLSACKYPKTPSFAAERHHIAGNDRSASASRHAATLSDVDRFLFENFNSLYTTRDNDGDDGDYSDADAALEDYLADDFYSPRPRDAEPPPDLRASRRFFVSPGTSNSLLEETRPSAASSTSSSSSAASSSSTATVTQPPLWRPDAGDLPAVPGDGVAVMTFSKDPYEDFRRSMQEMVEARHSDPREPLDWDFMEELLICYLKLNDRSVHAYVLGAFTDLVVAARRQRASPRSPGGVPSVVKEAAAAGAGEGTEEDE
ncbi:hypothetical protein Taro_022066 [Colocasia esculenta]|uniref:Transcription repressor n=1 Tax=Colocasia esculenta TaxID=4460 RepID=A0A843VDD0_COLES|nr:hypothetical protein [Colocasia esculenta]